MNRKYKSSGFTQVGTNHRSDDKNNQDAIISGKNQRYDVIVLADGVSSCKKGGEGARITVEAVKNYFLKWGERLINMYAPEREISIHQNIQRYLQKQAEEDGVDIGEYASTLEAILVDKVSKKVMYASIGDGLILKTKNNKVAVVSMPTDSRNGTPTTVDSSKYLETGVLEPVDGELAADSFMLCSDGAWKELYYRTNLRPEISEMILKRDYKGISEYLKGKKTFDDCSFITLDIEKVIEKGKQTPLESKKAEKLSLEEEARKISELEGEIDKVEQNNLTK